MIHSVESFNTEFRDCATGFSSSSITLASGDVQKLCEAEMGRESFCSLMIGVCV